MPVHAPKILLQPELQALRDLAPDADPGVLALALEARSCAVRHGEVAAEARLAVIDYSQPSTEKRLWVFDVAEQRLLQREYVAHGSGSGENLARRFSNDEGSYQTSLGLYRTAETYIGKNGYSLRMDGLDPGFNDNARQRAIVMHGAWYANPELIRTQGRLGRSQGCPALREQIANVVIDELKQRNLVFAYADDAAWLERGRSFACDGRSAAQILAAGRDASRGGPRVAATRRLLARESQSGGAGQAPAHVIPFARGSRQCSTLSPRTGSVSAPRTPAGPGGRAHAARSGAPRSERRRPLVARQARSRGSRCVPPYPRWMTPGVSSRPAVQAACLHARSGAVRGDASQPSTETRRRARVPS